ncbi:hypothetical protein [Phormidesmis priestleyi]
MAYSDFTLAKVKKELGINVSEGVKLFPHIAPIQPSAFLSQALAKYTSLAQLIGTEKAKSEFLVAPVLAEVRERLNNQISLFSGSDFTVDLDKGLQGFCDFILSASPEQLEITAPVMTIVEARNDNLKNGIGQCMAEMVAAQIFNTREEQIIDPIYGAVTTGSNWLFMNLSGNHIQIDDREYFLNEIDLILT